MLTAWARSAIPAALALLAALAVPVGTAAASAAAPDLPDADTLTRLQHVARAEFQPAGAAPPPSRALDLPHRWDNEFNGRAGTARYSVELPAGSGPRSPLAHARPLTALLLERAGNQFSIFLDGMLIEQVGTPGDAWLDTGKGARVVLIPTPLLDPSRPHTLTVELAAQAQRHAGLWPMKLGSAAAAERQAAWHRLWHQQTALVYASCLLLMGGLAVGLWWRQRDPLYGCFGLAAIFGSVRHIDASGLVGALLPWPAWGGALAICYGIQLNLIGRFALMVLTRYPPWLARALHISLALTVVLAGLSFWLARPLLWTLALTQLAGVGLLCFRAVLGEARHSHQPAAWLVLGAGSLLLLAGAHDLLRVRMGWWGGDDLALAPHALFGFVLLTAGLVVSRYSRSVADHRLLTRTLEARIDQREAQLRQAFEALRSQQQAQAVGAERQRIMREIHDGIGSQLVGLLGMVEKPSTDRAVLHEQVRLALDEMRIAVDSLQPMHNDLTTLLGTLRYRLQPRLAAAGIEVVWAVSSLPPMPALTPQAMWQLQRILLEAFTNVLKHARASRVTVSADWQPEPEPAVLLRLVDNGVGLGRDPAGLDADRPAGLGLENMRSRALAIGALLSVEPAMPNGTCVAICWPMAGAGPSA